MSLIQKTTKQNGITLISLIITIIILIILVAVAINTLFNLDILDVAQKTTQDYAQGQYKEKAEFDKLNEIINNGIVKEKIPENIYVKLYEDGTLIFSNTDYIDTERGKYIDYKDISKTIYNSSNLPEWSSEQVKEVIVYNKIIPTNVSYWFCNNSKLEKLDLKNLYTNNVTNMDSMFSNCTKITSLDISNFKTDNVTSMQGMFQECRELKILDVSNFETGNVTNMWAMFYDCIGLTNLNILNFETNKVTSMKDMFGNCISLSGTIDISNFEINDLTETQGMFYQCNNLTLIYVDNENIKAQVSQYANVPSNCNIEIKNV